MVKKKSDNQKKDTGIRLVLPFFAVMALLTVVSFLIPLRPTRSQMEKRELAQFPEFSWSALMDGAYFDEITIWFSDTFPGREQWLMLSSSITGLHGHSEITIAGDLPVVETVPEVPEVSETLQEGPTATLPDQSGQEEPTEPEEESWGGVDGGADVEMGTGAVIQIGDSAFNPIGFSQPCSDRYAAALSKLADRMEEKGVQVVSAPSPTSIGILVEPEYLKAFNSSDQKETIRYMHEQMNDKVVKVDTYQALVAHNDEYIYFRTDHHWTALGAYYSYEAICNAVGLTPMPLEEFREWDQGEMEGSLYWKVAKPQKLKLDNIDTYVPPYDIDVLIHTSEGYQRKGELVQDVTDWKINAKYSAFICSDNPLTIITNHDLPEAPNCLVIKDSFGNALAPFLAASYHKVVVLDYRKPQPYTMDWIVQKEEIDQILYVPYVIATQAMDGSQMLAHIR